MNKQYYKNEGKKYPRVTSICNQLDKSQALTYWAAGCACDYILQKLALSNFSIIRNIIEDARTQFRTVSQEALDIGGQVHSAIERWLNTGEEPKDPQPKVLAGFIAFLEWHDERKIKTLKTEHTLYGERALGGYAGTCDWICEFDNKTWVIDFKTSKKPKVKAGYEEWLYQLSAYRLCILNCDAMGVLRLDKETGMPDWYPYTNKDYRRGLDVFNVLTNLWYLRHPNFKQEV